MRVKSGSPPDIETYVQGCGQQMHYLFYFILKKADFRTPTTHKTCKCTAPAELCAEELDLWRTLIGETAAAVSVVAIHIIHVQLEKLKWITARFD